MTNLNDVFGSDGYPHQVTIYLPTTVDVDKPLSDSQTSQQIRRTVRWLSLLAGGATAIPARGGWVSRESGDLIVEDVTLVYAFFEVLTRCHLGRIKRFCELLKRRYKQESIALEVNGKLWFL